MWLGWYKQSLKGNTRLTYYLFFFLLALKKDQKRRDFESIMKKEEVTNETPQKEVKHRKDRCQFSQIYL